MSHCIPYHCIYAEIYRHRRVVKVILGVLCRCVREFFQRYRGSLCVNLSRTGARQTDRFTYLNVLLSRMLPPGSKSLSDCVFAEGVIELESSIDQQTDVFTLISTHAPAFPDG